MPPNGYTTHIDRIKGGDDVNVVLQGPVIQNTITSFNYYVQVGETSGPFSGLTQPDGRGQSFPARHVGLNADGASDRHIRNDDRVRQLRRLRLWLCHRYEHRDHCRQ